MSEQLLEQFYRDHINSTIDEIDRIKNKIDNLLDGYNNGKIAKVPAKALFIYLTNKLASLEVYLETL